MDMELQFGSIKKFWKCMVNNGNMLDITELYT